MLLLLNAGCCKDGKRFLSAYEQGFGGCGHGLVSFQCDFHDVTLSPSQAKLDPSTPPPLPP